MCREILPICVVFFTAWSHCAAEDPVYSGPQVGERLAPFDVQAAYGPDAGQKVDLVSSAEGNPLLIVFIHELTRPSADLSRVLMHYGDMRRDDGLHCAQVLLDDDRSKLESYLKRASSWFDVGSPVGISLDGAEGPGVYGLNRNVTLTVLVASENRVTANFAIVQPSVTDAPKVLAEVSKLIGGEPLTTAETEFLRAPSRPMPIPAARRHGHGPRDPHLRQLFCQLLRSTGNGREKQSAVAAIESYVESKPQRREQLYQAARLVTEHRYGGSKPIAHRVPDLRQVMKRWIEKYSSANPDEALN